MPFGCAAGEFGAVRANRVAFAALCLHLFSSRSGCADNPSKMGRSVKFLLKLFLSFFLLCLGTLAYYAWMALTPGERYQIIDQASAGDLDGVQGALEFKAGEELRRQQENVTRAATDAIQDLSDQLIEQTTAQIKAGADAAAQDTKKQLQQQLQERFRNAGVEPEALEDD